MFQFNTNDYKTYFYPTVKEAYAAYLNSYATQGDYDYYQECCGLNLKRITDPSIMESIFRNVFECVIFSGYVENVQMN